MNLAVSKNKIIAGVAAAAFLGPFTQTVYTPALVRLQGVFQVNTFQINLTISLFTAILAFSNFFIGPMADRWGRRAILLPGLLVFALGSLICMLAPSYGYFLLGRLTQAAGISTAILVAATVIGDIYAPSERAKAMSFYQTINFLGPVLGPVIGGLIAAHFYWQGIFGLLIVGAMSAWLYNRRYLPETLPADVAPLRFTVQSFTNVFRNRSGFSILLLGFSQFYGYYVFLVFLPLLLDALFHIPAASQGFFFVPLTAGLMGGVRLGQRWQRHWTRTRILNVSSLGIATTVLLFWIAMKLHLLTVPLLIAILLLYGLLLGCSIPVQSTILINVFEKQKGTAVGIYNFARFIGAALGPLAGGLIVLRYQIDVVFLSLGVMLVVAALVINRFLIDPYESNKS
jgi:DHA1 family bicyclomycin/chloramphenicol resistance-like MFS transporter